MNPDTDPDPIRIQDFDDEKLKRINTAAIFYIFFISKIAIYLWPSYKRNLQPSKLKREHPALQKIKFINFFLCL
jgi:hypothetical protein